MSGEFNGFSTDFVDFFKELKANNNRDWFAENKQRYKDVVQYPLSDFIAALAPHLEFTLNRVFTRTIDMIAEILWQFDDPAEIEQAFTLFWQYHPAGLQSLLKDHPAPNR